ncbi:MAG: glycosyltransferase family 2 protein [Verrucomicrobiota bacterium]
MSNLLLSVVMIVKDEEKNLPRCLDSVKEIAQEIVIIDTGSTDKTLEIAESYQAKTGFFAWNGDEAAARNESLKIATGSWVLVLDADQELSSGLQVELINKLRNINQDNSINAITFLEENKMPQGTSNTVRTTRVFRRFDDLRFEGEVHPQLNQRQGMVHLNGKMIHYGYMWDAKLRQEKGERMLKRLRPLVKGDKPDLSRLCQLMSYLLITGENKEFEQRFQLINQTYSTEERLLNNYWRQDFGNFLVYFSQQNKYEMGLRSAQEILKAYPHYISASFYLCQYYMKQENWIELKRFSKQVLKDLENTIEVGVYCQPELYQAFATSWLWLAHFFLEQNTSKQTDLNDWDPISLSVLLFAKERKGEQLSILPLDNSHQIEWLLSNSKIAKDKAELNEFSLDAKGLLAWLCSCKSTIINKETNKLLKLIKTGMHQYQDCSWLLILLQDICQSPEQWPLTTYKDLTYRV